MTLPDLIEAAIACKGSRKIVADGLGQDPQRLTDWKAGRRKPDAHEIAFLAECAGLPILETVAEIESQLDDRYAHIWREALGKLKAAGVAASSILILQGLLAGIAPENAQANQRVINTDREYVAAYSGDIKYTSWKVNALWAWLKRMVSTLMQGAPITAT